MKVTPEEKKQILQSWSKGDTSITAIGFEIGVDVSDVRRIIDADQARQSAKVARQERDDA